MAICKSCGADVPEGSEYCPRCGRRMAAEGSCDSRDEWRNWRHTRRMDRWGDWHGEDWMSRWSWTWSPLWALINAVIFGLGIVLVGTLLFLASSDVLSLVSWDNFWAYLLIGLGVLGVIRESAKFYLSGRFFWPGGMVFALILIVLGGAGLVAQFTNWSEYWWTFVILAGGLMIILIGIINYFWMRGRQRR